LKSVGIWLGATLFGVLAARRIGTGLKALGGHNEMAIMALGLAMIVAGLFEEAHLAMIIGAYVMGLSLSRTDISHVVREALHPVFAFLVPLFFTVMGMMVDVTQFMNPRILLFGVLYTIGAVVAKLVGCGLPTLLCGFNLMGALRVGLGMVPRGEVALIVAGIGLASGCLTPDVFGVAVFMTLLTTVIPPPFLVRAFRSARPGLRDSAKVVAALPQMIYAFPTPQVAHLMLSHLLDAIRREGFFVHTLDHGRGVYQARKDAAVIGITFERDRISFEVDRRDVEFVKTAMGEVMAEIEETLKALRHPLDAAGILKQERLNGANGRQGAAEKLWKHVRMETVTPALQGGGEGRGDRRTARSAGRCRSGDRPAGGAGSGDAARAGDVNRSQGWAGLSAWPHPGRARAGLRGRGEAGGRGFSVGGRRAGARVHAGALSGRGDGAVSGVHGGIAGGAG